MFEDMDRHIGRIRLLLGMRLSRDEIHFQVMTGDRRPSESDFFLAYKAAEMLDESDHTESQLPMR
jgi:hypothetical protein